MVARLTYVHMYNNCYIGAVALNLWGVRFNTDVISEVSCDSSKVRLLDCPHVRRGDDGYHCSYNGGAAVSCREEKLRVKNVSSTTVGTPHSTILVSWELYSGAPRDPSSFKIQCFNQQHHNMELFVNNGTLTQINVGNLFSSTSYFCCVSTIYHENHRYYATGRRCTSTDMLPSDSFTIPAPTEVPNHLSTTTTTIQILKPNSSMIPAAEKVGSSDFDMRESILIGGVLGSIIVILLLLLAICGGALLYLLRSRSVIPKR